MPNVLIRNDKGEVIQRKHINEKSTVLKAEKQDVKKQELYNRFFVDGRSETSIADKVDENNVKTDNTSSQSASKYNDRLFELFQVRQLRPPISRQKLLTALRFTFRHK